MGDDSGFFPTREDGWVQHAMIVEPGTEAVIYQVEIPDGNEEIEGALDSVILSSPVRPLDTGDIVYIAEDYIDEDGEGFIEYPQVVLVRQVGDSLYN